MNNVIKSFLICIFVPLIGITTMAQVDERFFGDWVLETAEFRESEFSNPHKEVKRVYTPENITEMMTYFDAVTRMKFVKEQAPAELENEQDTEELTDTVAPRRTTVLRIVSLPSEINFITTLTARYENPVMQILDRYFIFSDPSQPEGERHSNSYGYEFLTPEKILLITNEIFYANNNRESMKAQLYLTLTRLPE